jgi:hypothetical protein
MNYSLTFYDLHYGSESHWSFNGLEYIWPHLTDSHIKGYDRQSRQQAAGI